MDQQQFREQTAARLLTLVGTANRQKAFIGLDGFVDEIIHVVGKRDSAESYQRLSTIKSVGERIMGAAGKSTNIELVNQRTKLGGNGPIMANALAAFGIQVTYVGTVGYPSLHPVFNELAQRAEVHSIAEPGHTDALEFDDGKLMLTKTAHFSEINWELIQARYGHDKFLGQLAGSELVGFVNWTMIPYMSEIWAAVLKELKPVPNSRKILLFDLCDPEKRTQQDILRALELITAFAKHFDVILGVNEKEGHEIGHVLGLDTRNRSKEGLCALAKQIQSAIKIGTVLLHPTAYAIGASEAGTALVDGPFTEKPLITTGAGDHFNAGFCLGKLLGFEGESSLQLGVTASGYYVRNGQSPSIDNLAQMLRNWPK